MDFFEASQSRYSYKHRYAPTPVPLAHLEMIAAAGLAAPTGNNSQCVSLVLLDRPALDDLEAIVHTNGFSTAPAGIALFTDPALQTGSLMDFAVEDYAAAASAMSLAAVALGYVSVWLDYCLFDPANQAAAKQALGIPDRCRIRVVLPIGLPAEEEPRRPKKPFAERVSYGRYGRARDEV